MFDKNFINNIELMHGVYSGTNKYPEIYYKPKIMNELSNTIIYDTTSISATYSDEFIYNRFKRVFDTHPELEKKKVVFKTIANRTTPDFGTDSIVVNNIFEYCDVLASCKIFVCLMSGGCVLASALKQTNEYPKINCFHHSNPDKFNYVYIFDNVEWEFS